MSQESLLKLYSDLTNEINIREAEVVKLVDKRTQVALDVKREITGGDPAIPARFEHDGVKFVVTERTLQDGTVTAYIRVAPGKPGRKS